MADPNKRASDFQREFGGELNSPRDPGENRGSDMADTIDAHDIKAIHDLLPDLNDAALKELRVMRPGARLDEGSVYYDLCHPERGEFTGMNNMTVEAGCYIVPKADTGYDLWNWITNERDPNRINRFREAA